MKQHVSRRGAVVVFAATAAVAAGLATPASAQRAIEVVVQYTQPQIFDKVFDQLKADFEAENPDIKIKFRGAHKDYTAGIQALLREAVVGEMAHVDYVGLSYVSTIDQRGLAVDLAPLMRADNSTFEKGGWTPPLQSLGKVGEKQLGLPFALSMSLVYFNADLVRKAGFDPAAMPRDWDGLLKVAGKVRALGPDIAGMYMPYASNWYGAWYFQGVLFGLGGEMMPPGAQAVAFDKDPHFQRAFGLYRRMVDEGGFVPLADQAARQQFIAGRMGLFIDSISRLNNFSESIGDRFRLGTSPHPVGSEAARLPSGGNVAIITKAAEKDPAVLAAAWKWLKYSTGPHGTNQVIRNVGYTPVNVLALEDPKLLKGYFDDRPLHKTAVDQLPLVREWFQYPGTNAIKIDEAIGQHLESVVDKSMTPDQALVSLTKEVNRLLPR
ncbi:extracellular solute-binding protein [Bradyrhizobium sp. LHD-71]|uniref:extracellular solute-binding protein n=1 Tax=Bradyrhizobium sp. LHD-71 TaxID=3072141 RepID=UPI00280CFDC6|nr:extracellular solute-binding protein [Bradyrhizobium sp. LHD-71]MDQ8726835.1 extracellular solute-binding protein [Bradyrhizobium sp. LHD-71]